MAPDATKADPGKITADNAEQASAQVRVDASPAARTASPQAATGAAAPADSGAPAVDPEAATAAARPPDLDSLRVAIEQLDFEMLVMLNRRAELSLQVAETKRQGGPGVAVLQPRRESYLLDMLMAQNKAIGGPLPTVHMLHIWREIFSSSRALQQPAQVAFLGPEGTFSHMAALESLGHSVELMPLDSFHAVFHAVHDHRANIGIVPLENTLQGSVGQNFDLFAEYRVQIVAEHYSRITHSLMSLEADLCVVRRVYSHPQPLGQCAAWLRSHLPGVPLVTMESTAAAARRVLDEPGAAAIAHPALAAMLGLRILAGPLEDSATNWTRFAIITPGQPAPNRPGDSGKPAVGLKTSLLFTVPNSTGALSRVLNVLAEGKVNMSKLESRPMQGTPWQYVFFADTDCDFLHPDHAVTLQTLREVCQSVRILGVYPHADAPT